MSNSTFGGFAFGDDNDNDVNIEAPGANNPIFAAAAQPVEEPKKARRKKEKAPKEPKAPKAPKTPKAPKEPKEKGSSFFSRKREAGTVKAPGRNFRVMALGATVLTFLGAVFVLGSEPAPTPTYVVRATQALNPGLDLPASLLIAVPVEDDAVEPGAITGDTAEGALEAATGLIGQRALYPVFESQQIRAEMFSTVAENFGRNLADNERLVSISASSAVALGGSLTTGDSVDIIAVDREGIAVLVASQAEIVAVAADESAIRAAQQRQSSEDGQTLSAAEILPSEPIPGIYTLRVSATEAMPLAIADATAQIYLLGRSADAQALSPVMDLREFACSLADEENPLAICVTDADDLVDPTAG